MAYKTDPNLMRKILRYNDLDIEACFNCGNCTAVCSLSKGNDAMPRRAIRYAQLGLRDNLIAGKELWLCHHCTECSETCPRQAGPAEFMAAARRYATSSFDPSGLAGLMFRSKAATALVMIVLGILFSAILLFEGHSFPQGDFSTASMLSFVPFHILHDVGIIIIVVLMLLFVVTLGNMLWTLARAPIPGGVGDPGSKPGMFPFRSAVSATVETVREILMHTRHRECAEGTPKESPLLSRWFLHLCTLWGFLGLAAATTLDLLFKDPNLHVPVWYPMRFLGIVAGILFLYGTTAMIINRLRLSNRKDAVSSEERYYAETVQSDWLLLVLLWVVAASGFPLTFALYIPAMNGTWLYIMFLLHVVLAMELLIFLPFTKFAHAVYRPMAIWFQNFRRIRIESGKP